MYICFLQLNIKYHYHFPLYLLLYQEKASKEYYEKYGDYFELPDSISASDTTEAALQVIAERDSLLDTIPPPPPVGFNIAGAFGLFFIFIALIPIIIGCILLFVAYRMKKK